MADEDWEFSQGGLAMRLACAANIDRAVVVSAGRLPPSVWHDARCNTGEDFAGVADWPSINQRLEAESFKLLASLGISAWQAMGGVRGYDGSLRFADVSDVAHAAFNAITASAAGFRWTDDQGHAWAVRLKTSSRSAAPRTADAISCGGDAALLDPHYRQVELATIEQELKSLCVPGRRWNDDDRRQFRRLAQAQRRLQLISGAIQVLDALAQRAARQRRRRLIVSADDVVGLAAHPTAQNAGIPADVDAMSLLEAAARFRIAKLRFSRLGWCPHITFSAAAIGAVRRRKGVEFVVDVSPRLAAVFKRFAAPALRVSRVAPPRPDPNDQEPPR